MVILGADPGLSGAIAIYRPATGALVVEDMPTFTLHRNKKAKSEVNVPELARIIDAAVDGKPAVAFVEEVGAMPGQGVASMFSFGRSFGTLLGCLAMVETHLVPPVTWKRSFKLGKEKDASRAKATQLFPQHSGLFCRVKDDGRAEAALIAVYGAQVLRERMVIA